MFPSMMLTGSLGPEASSADLGKQYSEAHTANQLRGGSVSLRNPEQSKHHGLMCCLDNIYPCVPSELLTTHKAYQTETNSQ